ncbi:MAG: N-acetyltransferase family protein [Thainema sp.]
MELKLRPATATDYPAVCHLFADADELFLVCPRSKFPLTVEQMQQIECERHDLTVAEHENTVVGFANLYNVVPGERAFIGNVIIHRDYRGRGWGKQLLQYMMARVAEHHQLPQIHISVMNSNTPALLLYARLGFQPYAMDLAQTPKGNWVGVLHLRQEVTR